MRDNLTELVFILDRSGSMEELIPDMIGGFNDLIRKQSGEPGEAIVSTVLFDDTADVVHDRIPISRVPKMTRDTYYARGCTALLDAMGGAIDHIHRVHQELSPSDQPAHTMMIIMTDGYENASSRYSIEDVRRMVTKSRSEYDWEFLFLGANMDAIATASTYGIEADRAATFCADSQGAETYYGAVGAAITGVRQHAAPMGAAWKAGVEADYAKRGPSRMHDGGAHGRSGGLLVGLKPGNGARKTAKGRSGKHWW